MCLVPAQNEVFGDPCAYVFKYLNVSYGCVDEVKMEVQREFFFFSTVFYISKFELSM